GWSVDRSTKVCLGVAGLRLGGGNAIGFGSSTTSKMKSVSLFSIVAKTLLQSVVIVLACGLKQVKEMVPLSS
nr:hypothetical protein [Tanacetum cinerariifolium]